MMARFVRQLAIACSAALAVGLALSQPSPASAQEGDAAKGEGVFKKCFACHRVGDNAKSMIGPVLNGVIGRQAGTVEGFKYSPLNHAAGEAGLIWTEERIFEYLNDPNAFLKKFLTEAGKPAQGATRMVFRLPNEGERKDVIAYLRKFSPAK